MVLRPPRGTKGPDITVRRVFVHSTARAGAAKIARARTWTGSPAAWAAGTTPTKPPVRNRLAVIGKTRRVADYLTTATGTDPSTGKPTLQWAYDQVAAVIRTRSSSGTSDLRAEISGELVSGSSPPAGVFAPSCLSPVVLGRVRHTISSTGTLKRADSRCAGTSMALLHSTQVCPPRPWSAVSTRDTGSRRAPQPGHDPSL